MTTDRILTLLHTSNEINKFGCTLRACTHTLTHIQQSNLSSSF